MLRPSAPLPALGQRKACWPGLTPACCVQGLKQHADDPAFQEKWRMVKQTAKAKAMAKVAELSGVQVPACWSWTCASLPGQ